jgi:hypothetical protein
LTLPTTQPDSCAAAENEEYRMRFTGIIPPVTTPFLADLSIDRAGYSIMIEQVAC